MRSRMLSQPHRTHLLGRLGIPIDVDGDASEQVVPAPSFTRQSLKLSIELGILVLHVRSETAAMVHFIPLSLRTRALLPLQRDVRTPAAKRHGSVYMPIMCVTED